MARLLPRERVLHAPPDLVDAVEGQRDHRAGEGRDPLEVGGEHERHRVHEEEEQNVEHVQVLVRDGRRDDAFHGLQRVQNDAQITKSVHRGAFAQTPHTPFVLDDGADLARARVRAVPRVKRAELPSLLGVQKQVGHARLSAAVARQQLVVRDRPNVGVPVPLPARGVPDERVQQIGEPENLRAISRQRVLLLVVVVGEVGCFVPARLHAPPEEHGGGDVEVAYPAVHGAERGLPLLVPLPRQVRAEHQQKRKHHRDAQVPVEVERHVALLVGRHAFAAIRDLGDVGEQAGHRRQHDLRHGLQQDRASQPEDLREEREGVRGELPRKTAENGLAGTAEAAVARRSARARRAARPGRRKTKRVVCVCVCVRRARSLRVVLFF